MSPRYFASAAAFGRWLENNHDRAAELWVGFWKKGTGKPTLTWPDSVDEALCWGWIDGLRRSVDDERYAIRFTPRKPASTWSRVNIAKVEKLTAEGRMRPPGLAVWRKRDPEKSEVHSYENRKELSPAYRARLRSNADVWAWWSAQPPGYRRTAGHWVMAAKREETRERRLATLIAEAGKGRKIKPLRRKTPPRAPKK